MEEKIMAILNDICGADEGELEPDFDLFEEEFSTPSVLSACLSRSRSSWGSNSSHRGHKGRN